MLDVGCTGAPVVEVLVVDVDVEVGVAVVVWPSRLNPLNVMVDTGAVPGAPVVVIGAMVVVTGGVPL